MKKFSKIIPILVYLALMFISYFCFYRLRKEFVERIELDSSLRSFDYNPSEVYALFYDIQKAVKNENATGLASLITYPIRVFIKDKYVILELPEEFVKSYHEIVNKNVRRTILNAKADDIWVNWQGIRMFENGILIVGDKIAAFCFNYDYNTDRHDVEYYNNRGREIIRPLSTNDEYKILTEIERKGWKADCNWLDYTVYYADINNDTTNDYVITWMSGGSGGFTQIDSVWDKVSESEYVRLPIEKVFAESFNFDEEDFEWHDVQMYLGNPFLIRANGRIFFQFDFSRFYLWEGDRITLVSPPSDIVDYKKKDKNN